jgi:phenylalanyl-tRNA synthetase beta subunit
VRSSSNNLLESVKLIDSFNKNGKESLCYSVHFRSLSETLTNEFINKIYFEIREELIKLGYELR